MKKIKSTTAIARTVLLNQRLAYYRYILEYAVSHDYIVTPLEEFYSLSDRRNAKHFVLRHDVDYSGISTRKMFELERKMGFRSTYYFRNSTVDIDLIKEMISSGYEVGLHFETIADYIKDNACIKREEIDLSQCEKNLEEDILHFESLIGAKINSICSHGAPENRRLNISNNTLTENQVLSKYGVLFEAYDREMYDNSVDCHVMDGTILINYGFAYKDTPISAIDQGHQNIVFLSHPNHWVLTGIERIKLIRRFALGKAKYDSDRVFKRISS